MFIDQIRVFAKAGNGGKGAVAFLRETFRPKGGPSGGNGGRGGDVILEADHDINNLIAQYYVPRLIARNGGQGMGKGMDGKAGDDLVVKVPCGTIVWRIKENQPTDFEGIPIVVGDAIKSTEEGRAIELNLEDSAEPTQDSSIILQEKELVTDLTFHGQRHILCKGGRGGLGNRNFATARRQAPRFAQPGETGEESNFLFELRMIAEVGLVGFPNAGKSTLLTAISDARPKIAPYPFTTLTPQVGIVIYEDFSRITVCDVPGLIEGAHKNVGLGHAFLRHIKRCHVIAIVLDMEGTDGRNPSTDYVTLLKELELYDSELLAKPRIVVCNKMDEPNAGKNLKAFKRKHKGTTTVPMAAGLGEGIDCFKDKIREFI